MSLRATIGNSGDSDFQGHKTKLPRHANNPAGQALTESLSNPAFAWDGQPTGTAQVDYTANGLNQYTQTSVGANTNPFTYDANGNLASDNLTSYTYDTENRLIAASGG